MKKLTHIAALLATAGLLIGCTPKDDNPDALPKGAGDNWVAPGGDAGKSHYSRLTDINPENVATLGFAWDYDMGTFRVQEATPVVIDGVMYTSGTVGLVYALDAATGRELWTFEPEVDMQVNRTVCCDQANRGVAVTDGKVFVSALDGMLYALDAKTGDAVWQVDAVVDHKRGYSSTGAPEVAGDIVIIGNAGAEYDVRGYVSAYHVKDGTLAWRFYTVPRDPALGPQESPDLDKIVDTWAKDSRWDIGGGGTVWDAINYDPAFDTVLIGVGNGGPYAHGDRSPGGGDNLYLSSLVALDRSTGRVKWHYQETPKDSWDFTATQPMILTELEVDGELRPVILHAPKNGYLFVIDRESGKPIAINALVRTNWTKGFDRETRRAILAPERTDYTTGPKIIFPSSAGARNWYPPAFDPDKKLYYASVIDMGNLMFSNPGPLKHKEKALNVGSALIFTSELMAALPALPPFVQDALKGRPELEWVKEKPYSSELRAIDPMTGNTVWATDQEGWQDRGGVLATKSNLLFHGTVGGKFNARDSRTGELLKSIETGSSMLAAPMTYRVDGVQYVAIAAGWGGGGWSYVPRYGAAYTRQNVNRILVFKLGGGEVPMPDELPPLEVAPEPPAQAEGVTAETIGKGTSLFYSYCAMCHSNAPRSISPDLRRLSADTHALFNDIVLGGLLVGRGMPRWDDHMTEEDAAALHAYLIDLQTKTRARELKLQELGKPLDTREAMIMSNY